MTSRLISPASLRALAAAVAVASLVACGERPPAASATKPPAAPARGAAPAPTSPPALPPEIAGAVSALLADPRSPVAMTGAERRSLAAAYGTSGPWWIAPGPMAAPAAREALALLTGAEGQGLHPADYDADALNAIATGLQGGTAASEAALFDLRLSVAMVRYLRHLHRGHADPRAVGFQVTLPVDEHDYAALVREAVRKGSLQETATSIEPPLVQYRLLRAQLPTYRRLAAEEGTRVPALGPAPRKSLKPGDRADGLGVARARLQALGDRTADAATSGSGDPSTYDAALVEAVQRFQARHGYEADGVLGKATWAALATPFSWRLRQIELAMERMRWLPHLGDRPFVAVNIPMFRLFAWEKVPSSGAPDFSMGVIVGKALKAGTPVFVEEMEYVIFRPYWNVPKSILQKEIVPILRRNLGYLAREDMEMVLGQGDDARAVAATVENVERLAAGELRLRQRPGRKNSLGQVKFMFPNDENVYLHGTPAVSLFGRARRDFSHGCVRVEDPPKLARWVLRDQPEWTPEAIAAAMNGKPSLRVNLKEPLRVVMYYVTAAVIPEDGTVHFADDIYRQDAPLDRALAALHQAGRRRY
jgi:murein L,D-transpeptidase YcbB/YkuD